MKPSNRPADALADHIQVWRILRSHQLAIGLIATLVVAGAATLTWRQTPIYSAAATVRIEATSAQVVKFDDVTAPTVQYNRVQYQHFYQTQHEILRSRLIAVKAMARLREERAVEPFAAAPDPVSALMAATRIEPVPDSQLVKVSVEHPDPKLAALTANALAEAFIEHNLAVRLGIVEQAARFLDRQFEDWKQRRLASERKLLDYKEEQDIFDLEDRQDLATRHLGAVSGALDETRRDRIEAEARYQKLLELSTTPEGRSALPSLVPIPAIDQVLTENVAAELAYERAKARYGDNMPPLKQAEKELAATRSQLDAAVDRAVRTARARFELLQGEEAKRTVEVERAKAEVADLARRSVDMGVLEAEVQRTERFFETLDTRRAETDISALLRNNNINLIDEALPPKSPIRPIWPMNMVLAIVMGLCLGVATAFAIEFADNTVKSPDEVEAHGIAHLGNVPSLAAPRPNDSPDSEPTTRVPDVFTEPRSHAAECFRVVRTNLRFVGLSRPAAVMVVTSASPREGKSITTANLGATLAMGGQRVLVVDSDLRRPCLHKIFGTRNTIGLTNVLMGEMTVEEAVKETGVPNLYLLPSGPLPPNPAEVIAASASERLIKPARELFDVVICDSSPLLAVTDPVVLGSLSDGIVLVVRHALTTRDMLRAALRACSDVRESVLGFVMNDLDAQGGYYGYHYTYYAYGTEGDEGGDDRRGKARKSPRDRAARAS